MTHTVAKALVPIVLAMVAIAEQASYGISPAKAQGRSQLNRATLTNLHNRVLLQPKSNQRRTARPSDILTPGDQLATGRASSAEFKFNEGTLARMGERALFRFIPRQRSIQLDQGTTLLLIPPGRGRSYVRTPNVVTGIRGSALFVRHDATSNTTVVGSLTDSGIKVSELGGNESQVLKAGQMLVAVDGKIQGLYDLDLKTFYATSPLAQGILEGGVGHPAVLEEIQAGLAAQGDFALAENGSASAADSSASKPTTILETPQFLKLSETPSSAESAFMGERSGSQASQGNNAAQAAQDDDELQNDDELAVIDTELQEDNDSLFPGSVLGISVGESETIEDRPPQVVEPPVAATEPNEPTPPQDDLTQQGNDDDLDDLTQQDNDDVVEPPVAATEPNEPTPQDDLTQQGNDNDLDDLTQQGNDDDLDDLTQQDNDDDLDDLTQQGNDDDLDDLTQQGNDDDLDDLTQQDNDDLDDLTQQDNDDLDDLNTQNGEDSTSEQNSSTEQLGASMTEQLGASMLDALLREEGDRREFPGRGKGVEEGAPYERD